MKFVSTTELQKGMHKVEQTLKQEKQVLVTKNGKPWAWLTQTSEDELERQRNEFIHTNARQALYESTQHSKKTGLNKLTLKEINQIIANVRNSK